MKRHDVGAWLTQFSFAASDSSCWLPRSLPTPAILPLRLSIALINSIPGMALHGLQNIGRIYVAIVLVIVAILKWTRQTGELRADRTRL